MTDNLKIIILNASALAFLITIIIILLILKHKEKKNMNKDLRPGTFSGDPKDYETSVSNEINLGKSDGRFDTICLNADHFILNTKIDLKGHFDKVNKIVVDGVTFVREDKE